MAGDETRVEKKMRASEDRIKLSCGVAKYSNNEKCRGTEWTFCSKLGNSLYLCKMDFTCVLYLVCLLILFEVVSLYVL